MKVSKLFDQTFVGRIGRLAHCFIKLWPPELSLGSN